MKKYAIVILTLFFALSGCNKVRLEKEEASELINKTLELPKKYREDIGLGIAATSWLDALQNEGLIQYKITYSGPINTYLNLKLTKLGEQYYLGQDPSNRNVYRFKTNDIEFNEITGISLDKESQIATVRFSVKATNVTLVAYVLAKVARGFSGKNFINYSLVKPLNGELKFKKFDSGWQLETEQGKSSSELLNQILESESNSNSNDDYSQQIQILHDEIKAKEDALKAKYSSHSDFNKFWADFKKAVNARDMEAICEMTNYPFVDNTYANGETGRLSATTAQQFANNFDKVFTPSVISAINSDKFRGWKDMSDDIFGSGSDVIKKGEFLLEVFGADIPSLAFSEIEGIFKLCFIPYYS